MMMLMLLPLLLFLPAARNWLQLTLNDQVAKINFCVFGFHRDIAGLRSLDPQAIEHQPNIFTRANRLIS